MNQAEKIYGKKTTQGKVHYYVKWKGKPETENSWCSFDNIENLDEVLNAFNRNSNEDTSLITMRKGSFSNNDEVKRISQIVWNEDTNQSMGEVEWQSPHLYSSLYPLTYLHDKCPREMCDLYYGLLKFTYSP
jgi:Chromo (CHRromatin Organisation MOdifier) domain